MIDHALPNAYKKAAYKYVSWEFLKKKLFFGEIERKSSFWTSETFNWVQKKLR